MVHVALRVLHFGTWTLLSRRFNVQRKTPLTMARRQYDHFVVSLYRSLGAPGSNSTLLHVRSPCSKLPQSRQSPK